MERLGALASADDAPQRGNSLLRRDGCLSRPVFKFWRRSTQPLVVGDQAGEICPQLRGKTRIAAKI
jgi:hypothetical protein